MRERILAGALEVFSEKGYSAATIKEISRRVNCNPVTVYRYFAGKQTLFQQVIERYHALELDEEDLQSRLGYLNVRSDLAAMAAYFFDLLLQHIHILRIFISDGGDLGEQSGYQWYLPAPFQNFVQDYLKAMYLETIPALDAGLIAELFVSYITQVCLRVDVRAEERLPARALAREVRDLLTPSVEMAVQLCRRCAGS